jgi:Ca2+/Na+ antiporter
MLISLIVLSVGIAAWVAGAFYERNTPDSSSTKGLAALPGCLITIAGFVAVIWHLLWWLGFALLLAFVFFFYRLIFPKYQVGK